MSFGREKPQNTRKTRKVKKMPGMACRALSKDEVIKAYQAFRGKYSARNRALFILGCYTGFRIGDLLKLRLKDVIESGVRSKESRVKNEISVRESKTGQTRTVKLTEQPKKILLPWLAEMKKSNLVSIGCYLFCKNNGKVLEYKQALRILQGAFNRAGINGRVATHSMRKTFVVNNLRILKKYTSPDDARNILTDLQQLTGHESIDSLIHYIPVEESKLEKILSEYGNEIII